MVLFKRKPVQYGTRPPLSEEDNIWVIEETDEIFKEYVEYLQRVDFYKQKRFICEITGHSGLDFFDALRSEMEASNEVDDAFPDSLKEPILRKVQFSTISRIDNLVDHIFDEFKQDFYPGENVTVILDSGERLNGVIREKTKFPELRGSDGYLERKGFARYFVPLTNRPEDEALVDDEHVVRDRKTFTKQMLRSFLKNTVSREAWAGAPWTVKPKIANDYRISTDIPAHLRYEHQVAQRKAHLTMKKGDYDGTILNFFSPQGRYPEIKPKSHKSKNLQQDMAKSKRDQFFEYQRALAGNPGFSFGRNGSSANDAQYPFVGQNSSFTAIVAKGHPKPPPPPVIKYPIEDLEIPPSRSRLHRPGMKYLSQDSPSLNRPSNGASSGILMESVGPLLETWDTLNVYCEVFQLDSFTFDDYIEALRFTSEDVQCELVVEIHCAILKKLVNDENDKNGQVQIRLPIALQEESEEEESLQDSSTLPTPTPEPEAKPVGRTTRSSLAKTEAAEIKAVALTDAKQHRAAEIDQLVRSYDWRFRLRKRDFRNGRWVVIVVGLLNLLAANPRLKKICDEVLSRLAPLEMDATEETAISQYATLDINLRVKILQILCMLSLETTAIRSYMEDCSYQMTDFRKEKIEQQRARKAAVEELKMLSGQKKALQPDDTSPVPELEDLEDVKTNEPEEDEDVNMDTEDEEPHQGRSLRRANDRAIGRKRRKEEEKERKQKAEADKAKRPTKQAKQLEKIMKRIDEAMERVRECEEEVTTLDNDLREADCPRTRVLGKDRFWNRYYWMERNAMPYAGLPTSSTANAGFANGRIWIQGPDDLERQGFIELADIENARYREAFHMSVPERKMIEEGNTHVFDARQWGYYDDPEELDKLIAWLDIRGIREHKLRKELQNQREKISTYMLRRKEYLASSDDKKADSAEPTTRVSTRTKTYVDPTGFRCLAWRNTTALEAEGHIHSEPVRGIKKQQYHSMSKSTKKVVVEEEPRQTRASNRAAKPLTRQGSRYTF